MNNAKVCKKIEKIEYSILRLDNPHGLGPHIGTNCGNLYTKIPGGIDGTPRSKTPRFI